ncbi:TadE/TadG family type IV pilus assembly protein [Novosphingobium mangrovi (ex Huang et al. 2023)]|uniref:Pilus assembly protein n=1 Tax=Novosphingobium mangrovi (ex Huang et al. 2023) TaxID=2976432 RepID=A0ABT2I6L6_9SPHN|nr:TadE/TadG family type IV pilus assembly protein [Novosphingobium mangrovi (ex Huang et al. 2023)]MCT2400456.1 pilus assembly protein [Novosphingobium mangrovi (ex Huang et al. 2023)]
MTGRTGMAGWERIVALFARCRDDRRGVTALEFALAGPVLIILLLGIFDIGHMTYVTSVLQGAVQSVARNSALETADTATEDAYVEEMVQRVAPGATVTTSRKSYYDFADIDRPESWNDTNNNGTCDNSETYTDENKNGRWDADVGKSGNGGANDVVVYTVTMTYKPLFPIPWITDSNATRTLEASAVKKNQPFSLQNSLGSAAGSCD